MSIDGRPGEGLETRRCGCSTKRCLWRENRSIARAYAQVQAAGWQPLATERVQGTKQAKLQRTTNNKRVHVCLLHCTRRAWRTAGKRTQAPLHTGQSRGGVGDYEPLRRASPFSQSSADCAIVVDRFRDMGVPRRLGRPRSRRARPRPIRARRAGVCSDGADAFRSAAAKAPVGPAGSHSAPTRLRVGGGANRPAAAAARPPRPPRASPVCVAWTGGAGDLTS